MEELIRRALAEGLNPEVLEVIDESHLHAGHAGARPGGETHYNVVVVSHQFEGVHRVERQQMVYGFLKEAFAQGLHALAMKTQTPEEYKNMI